MNEPNEAPIVWGATIDSAFRRVWDVVIHCIRYAWHSIKYFKPVRRYRVQPYQIYFGREGEDTDHEC